WTFRVSDKFGDSGLTGILSVEKDSRNCRIVDFVLSCRVMGRNVEETMLRVATQWATEAHLDELVAEYRPTAKNRPCLEFLQRSRLKQGSSQVFSWALAREYPASPEICLVDQSGGAVVPLSVVGRRDPG